jgi:transposase
VGRLLPPGGLGPLAHRPQVGGPQRGHAATREAWKDPLAEPAQTATLLDYLHEVEHAAARISRLEQAIDAALVNVPADMKTVIDALQALRGIAKVSAITPVAELGPLSRFPHPRELMGYTGIVSREHSSGERIRRGAISKTGNAHVRRIVVEAAWAYRH